MSRSSAQKSLPPKKIDIPSQFDPSRYVSKNLPENDVKKLKECFDIFDSDHSGQISP